MPDEGHYITELILQETEADVARVYTQAVEETQKKLDDYLRKFRVKDELKRKQLAAGEITKKEYTDWKTGQIMIGKRWEEMRDTLAEDLHNANNLARSIVNGHMPEVYAVNHNYATFQIEKESMLDTSYTLYDRDTVERIIREQPDILPAPGPQKSRRIAEGKDIAWQRGQIQSVTLQSILQGESIPNMAKRIATTMGETNINASVRYARTATTGAENAGRVAAYERADSMGIEIEQEWLATLDNRTRHSHRQMDGVTIGVNTGETFPNGCRYPGDPNGPGEEIWNCRCTLVPKIKGVDQSNAPRNSKLGSMTYEEWKTEHMEPTSTLRTPIDVNKYQTMDGNSLKKWAKSYHEFNDTIPDPYGPGGRWYEKGSDSELIYSHYVRSNTFNRINAGLRDGKLSQWRDSEWAGDKMMYQTTKALDRAIDGNSFYQDTVVRRFIGGGYLDGTFGSSDVNKIRDQIGSVFGNDQFMSTTTGYNKIFGKKPAVMTILCDKGTPAFPTTNYTEGEVILGRNTRYELIGVVEHGNDPMKILHTNGKEYEYSGLELIVHILN